MSAGNNHLDIPDDALSETVEIIFRRMPGAPVIVEVEVDGEVNKKLDFHESAQLTIDVDCARDALGTGDWFVWRVRQSAPSQSQKLRTTFGGLDTSTRTDALAVTFLDSASVYMIAN